jgi:hypothetical protein
MNEDYRTIRAVDWRGLFPFLHLFRSFRIAIHPSKILLAMCFLLTVYGAGRLMDAVWLGLAPSHTYYTPRQFDFLPEMYDRVITGDSASRSGPFDIFLKYELTQLDELTRAVLFISPLDVLYRVFRVVFTGPGWGFRMHGLYATLFSAIVLVAWAIFGGAIARISAVHVARDEKMSVRSALRFSSGKLLSFLFAPVLLGLFIGAMGLAVAVVNLTFYIPFVGPIVSGALFIVTIAIGFVMTLTIFGTFGGSSLMYPSIAVEGSDAFDSISRSFSYFFAKPWRLAFYTTVALVYGVATYLFMKFFVFVMLLLVRTFQLWLLMPAPEGGAERWGILAGGEGYRDAFEAFFPMPDFWSLAAAPNPSGVDGTGLHGTGMKVGAYVFASWYFLLVSILSAYAMSFYFSASTIMYYLLRRDVDATELEDVFLEDTDEDELSETSTSAAGASTATPVSGSTTGPAPASPANAGSVTESGAVEVVPALAGSAAAPDEPKTVDQPPTFASPPPAL